MDIAGVGSLRCPRWALVVVSSLLALFSIGMLPAPVSAATVNTDTTTGIAANCPGASCSLRDAVAFANANDSTTITFQAGLASPITLTQVTTLSLTRTTGSGTTITGPGVASLAVDGGYTGGNTGVTVLTINSGVTASISGLTIQKGNAGAGTGAGILNNGSLTLSNVTLRANFTSFLGGGLYSTGSLTTDANTANAGGGIYNTGTWNAQAGLTISNNTATQPGGGIYDDSGANTVTLTAPTISKNQATFVGGVAVNTNSTITITGGTIAGNQVTNGGYYGGGGGINNGGTLTLDAVTVGGTNPGDANTTTNGGGGGIFNGSGGGTLTVRNNSTILSNTAGNHGGGLFNTGTATITSSTIGGTTADSGNTTGGSGGGIYNSGGTITLSNARVAGNLANGINGSGGLFNIGSATITNSIIGGTTTAGGNSAPNSGGGGIANGFGATLHVTGSTTSGNSASSSTGAGGGIFNFSTSAVIDTTTIGGATAAEGNSAVVGGGIETQGSPPSSVTLTDSTISHNTTTGGAGGGLYAGSIVTISGSTISANATTGANQAGGGIEVAGGPVAITNSTISGNTATGAGGGIDSSNGSATLTLTQVTVAANSTGINTMGGVTIKNSILANTGVNCVGAAVTDGQYNLDSGTTCGLTDATDLTNTNPQLGPLQLNAPGTTATHALLANSPARDLIPNSGANCPATDQRAAARSAPAGGLCDIGAFEATPLIPAAITVAGFPSPITAGALGTFTVTITDSSGNTVTSYTGAIHFTSSDPQATAGAGLPANFTFPFSDRGSHTFTATLKTAGTQSITATDTVTATITGSQTGITVTPAAISALLVAGFPNPANANTPGTVTVSARDAFANLTPSYTGTVHLTSTDPLAILPADYTFTTGSGNDNGVHTFSVILKSAGSPPKSITATDVGQQPHRHAVRHRRQSDRDAGRAFLRSNWGWRGRDAPRFRLRGGRRSHIRYERGDEHHGGQ